MKGLYDMNLPYKFIVSGSGSLELKEKIHESLAGRKRIFELSTLSFTEFVNHKTDYQYEHNLPEFFALEKQKRQGLLDEYLSFGGYPRVVLEDTVNEKEKSSRNFIKATLSAILPICWAFKKRNASPR